MRALCTENGVDGNELLPGQVNVLVDLIPYVESVSNTTKTSGGADLESDESLAERIFLAPSGYSVAGPDDAYKYWTKTYSQTIGDVKVTSPRQELYRRRWHRRWLTTSNGRPEPSAEISTLQNS